MSPWINLLIKLVVSNTVIKLTIFGARSLCPLPICSWSISHALSLYTEILIRMHSMPKNMVKSVNRLNPHSWKNPWNSNVLSRKIHENRIRIYWSSWKSAWHLHLQSHSRHLRSIIIQLDGPILGEKVNSMDMSYVIYISYIYIYISYIILSSQWKNVYTIMIRHLSGSLFVSLASELRCLNPPPRSEEDPQPGQIRATQACPWVDSPAIWKYLYKYDNIARGLIDIYIYMYYIYINMYTDNVYIFIYTYSYVYIYIHIHMCIYIYIIMYVDIFIYTGLIYGLWGLMRYV